MKAHFKSESLVSQLPLLIGLLFGSALRLKANCEYLWSLTGPTNIVVWSCTNVVVSFEATVFDECCQNNLFTNPTVIFSPAPGSSFTLDTTMVTGSGPYWTYQGSGTFAPGTTTVNCTASDSPCVNSSTNQFTVTVICPSCVPPPSDLVLWLPFDELSGSVAANLASPPNSGAEMGHPGPGHVLNAYVGNSLDFDGTGNQYVDVPDYPALEIGTNNLTIDAWVLLDASAPFGGGGVVVDKSGPEGGSYTLSVDNSTGLMDLAGYTGSGTGSGQYDYLSSVFFGGGGYRALVVPADGQWHFVAVSLNQTSATPSILFYVDGQALETTASQVNLANTADLWVGAASVNSVAGYPPWAGDLDEVEIYDRALSTNELAAIYDAQWAGKCKSVCVCTNCFPPYPLSYSVTVNPGYNYLADNLCQGTNAITDFLTNAPDGSQILVWNGSAYTVSALTFGSWNPSLSVAPGEGFVLNVPAGTAPFTITISGCQPLCPPPCIPTNGFSLVGTLGIIANATWTNLFSCPPPCGAEMLLWNPASQSFATYDYVNGVWTPSVPVLAVGESAFVTIKPNTICCVPPPTNMVLWLPFDELSGSVAANLASPPNPGTEVGSPIHVANQHVGNSLNFNGTGSQFVDVPNYPDIEIGTNSLTIDAWERLETNAPPPSIGFAMVDKLDSTGTGYALTLRPSNPGHVFLILDLGGSSGGVSGGVSVPSSIVVPQDGQWHFVAVAMNRTGARPGPGWSYLWYVDGVAQGGYSPPTFNLANTSDLRIGYGLDGWWEGDLDEVEVYDRALSTNELAAIYYAGKAGKCKPPSTNCLQVLCPTNKTVPCGSTFTFDPPEATTCCTNLIFSNGVATNVLVTSLGIVSSGCCPPSATESWLITDGCGNSNECSQTVTFSSANPNSCTIIDSGASGGALLANDAPDPSFILVSEPAGAGTTAVVISTPNGVWQPNDGISQWIGPADSGSANEPGGVYDYRCTFYLCCTNNFSLTGLIAVDDCAGVYLNAHFVGQLTCPSYDWTSVNSFPFAPYVQLGINTLDIYVTNSPGNTNIPTPTGMRAELTNCTSACCSLVLTCPTNIVVTTCSNCLPVFYSATATDSCCTNGVTLTYNLPSGSCFPLGPTTVSVTATDGCSNVATCSFTVSVLPCTETNCIDLIYPSPIAATVCGSNCAPVSFAASAIDYCCTNVEVSYEYDGTEIGTSYCFPPGRSTVSVLASDGCGNSNSGSFTVTVTVVTNPPVFVSAPTNVTICEGTAGSGALIVDNDEWDNSDTGFGWEGDGTVYATNCANYLTGNRARGTNILICSSNFSLNEGNLYLALTGAGYNVTRLRPPLPSLSGYAAVYVGGDVLTSSELSQLQDYICGGGGVYIAAGTGTIPGGAAGEAAQWNGLINNFGLNLSSNYNGLTGNFVVSSSMQVTASPVMAGVGTIYNNNGNNVNTLANDPLAQVIAHNGTNGLIGVSACTVASSSNCGLMPDLAGEVTASGGVFSQSIPPGTLICTNTTVTLTVSNACGATNLVVPVTLVKCCVPAPTNLMLWLPFDETNGTASANLASPADAGTQFGNPTSVLGAYVANSLGFNGTTNQYVAVPDYPGIEIGTNDLTIDAWVNRATNGPDSYPSVIVDKRDVVSGAGYSLSLSYGHLVMTLANATASGNYVTTASVVPPDGLWHFIAIIVSQSASDVSFYVDGAVTNTLPITPTDVSNTNSLWVGGSLYGDINGNDRHWTGDLDEVEIYDRALSTNEVYAIYSAGTAGKCKPCCYLQQLHIVRITPNSVEVIWGGCGTLEEATSLHGPWTPIPNAASPYIIPATGTAMFYRLECP